MISPRKAVRLVGVLLALLAVWWFILPPQLGGRTTLFMTKGISMEPYITQGDLAILHKKRSYHVGDVIAFNSDTVNTVALHRIIDIGPDGIITTQGDNNASPDLDRTKPKDVIGRVDHLVQDGAKYVGVLMSWPVRLIGAALIGMSVYGAVRGLMGDEERRPLRGARAVRGQLAGIATSRRRQDPTTTGSGGSDEGDNAGGWRNLALANLPYVFILAAALSGVILYVSLSQPLSSSTERTLPYNIRGKFGYSADTAAGGEVVYPDGQVSTGDPIYLSLVQDIFVTYSIDIDSQGSFKGSGTLALDAVVSGRTGWNHTIPLTAETTFRDDEYRTNAMINLAQIRDINQQIQRLTRTTDPTYTLTIKPRVRFDGELAGQEFKDDFVTALSFSVDDKLIKVQETAPAATSPEGAPGYDPNKQISVLTGLNPTKGGNLQIPAGTPTRMAAFGVTVGLATARLISFAGLAVSLALFGLSLLATRRMRIEAEDVSDEALSQYRSMLGEESNTEGTNSANVINVPTLTDLIAVAALYGESIQQHRTATTTVYFVMDGGTTYEHRVTARTAEDRFGVRTEQDAGIDQ